MNKYGYLRRNRFNIYVDAANPEIWASGVIQKRIGEKYDEQYLKETRHIAIT
jgi:hypothetical protein